MAGRGFECFVVDEAARGNGSSAPAFTSKDAALKFARDYSATGSGHEVHVIQRRNGTLLSRFRNGTKIL